MTDVNPLACTIVIVVLAAAPAAAQGRGKGLGRGGSGPVTSGSATPGSGPSGSGARQFGSWLDDASMLEPGSAWTALSFGHFRTETGRQTDFPVIDASIGLARRAQFGITVPYYRLRFADGGSLQGLGDVYVNAKFSLVDVSDDRPFGVAVSSMLEVLDEPTADGARVAWAVPVSLEFRGTTYRLFGSGGYFSRGTFFLSGAVEVPIRDRLIVTGALSLMRSVHADATADALQLLQSRADVTAVAAYFLTPSIAVFGGTGRTISAIDASGTSFMATGGVSLTFAPRLTP